MGNLATGVVERRMIDVWRYFLSFYQFEIVQFVYRRTLCFGKASEIIPERHFLKGVFIQGEAEPMTYPVRMGRAMLYRTIAELKAMGLLQTFARPPRSTEYQLITVWMPPKDMVKQVLQSIAMDGHRPPPWTTTVHSHGLSIVTGDINSMKVTGSDGIAAVANVKRLLETSAAKSGAKREGRKAKLDGEGLRRIWVDACRTAFPDTVFADFTVSQMGQVKAVVARLPSTLDVRGFFEVCIAHWSEIMLRRFGWMRSKPASPELGFFIRNIDKFTDAYTEITKTGFVTAPTEAKGKGHDAALRRQLEEAKEREKHLTAELNAKERALEVADRKLRRLRVTGGAAVRPKSVTPPQDLGLKGWDEE